MTTMTRHAEGAAMLIGAAVIWSTAGLFTKGVSAEPWAIIFWRGLAAAGFTLCWLAARGALAANARRLDGPALLVSVLMALGTAAFIPAFKLTTIANVALIYAGAPFLAAALAWVWLAERPTTRVMIASLSALAGVALIVGGSVSAGGLTGDLLALFMTMMMAAVMVVYRRWPDTQVALPAVFSSLLLIPPALIFGAPFNALPAELPIIAAFGLVFAVASVALSAGAARLPSAEAALLSALETPLAPIWAWLVLAERPALTTIIGGAVILAAVVWSQMRR